MNRHPVVRKEAGCSNCYFGWNSKIFLFQTFKNDLILHATKISYYAKSVLLKFPQVLNLCARVFFFVFYASRRMVPTTSLNTDRTSSRSSGREDDALLSELVPCSLDMIVPMTISSSGGPW